MIYVLNSAVLTAFGTYKFSEVSVEAVRELLQSPFTSAIGHEPTAAVLTEILELPIAHHRIQISMQPGDLGVVFRLKDRLPENTVLTKEAAQRLPYELGLLVRQS